MKQIIELNVNGESYTVAVNPWQTLNEVLREEINLTGVKLGCGSGDCGACTVMVDGRAVSSCLSLAVEMVGKEIMTVEGMAPSGEELHPIQESFVKKGAIQCGFCTPGMELTALNLLNNNPSPTYNEIREALAGNLCRCTGYKKIIEAVGAAGQKMKEASERKTS
ncbi:(2Fe-2S)-binding protein [Desulfonema magnum]|uniref:2Fe-2S ferredoxin iron-sulfur protein n=1 Tax=Desulfonema magnum TaxID=45655 RepID=A0A975BK23_9BACT|nr:(2Fe-2S)-binding protein [Desulfonema magnum]QTA87124.1 2Fe-2S ferredoxin iron-sulfur protein [Desulfonema magnum]